MNRPLKPSFRSSWPEFFSAWLARFRCGIRTGIIIGFLVCLGISSTSCADVVPAKGTAVSPSRLLSTNLSTASATSTFNVLDDQYRLAIGDQLSFRILEDEEEPKVLVVTDSGDVQLPYIGRYPVVGKTCKELAKTLKAELEKGYYYQATVVVAVDSKPKSRGRIYLVGAVRAPGPQEISSDEQLTVSKAILRAGGFAEFADQKNVRLTRGSANSPDEKQTFTVNVARIFEKGKTEEDKNLQPGDLIFIPERMIRF
jgi:protein involved in polysaccharide export with SLBB domain